MPSSETFDAASRHVSTYSTDYDSDCIANVPAQTTLSYDAENHSISSQSTSDTSSSEALSWGANGHPVIAAYNGTGGTLTQPPTGPTLSLHYDGDTLLFVTDAPGRLVALRPELLGTITPIMYGPAVVHDGAPSPTGNALTVYDRDFSDFRVTKHNAQGADPISFASGSQRFQKGFSATVEGYYPGAGSNANVVQDPFVYDHPDGFGTASGTIQGVRTMDPGLGTWATPDAYAGDVDDPMSLKPFMWNRNNPYEYSDPSGFAPCDDESCAEHAAGKGPPLQEIGHVVARSSADQLMPDGRSIRQLVASQRAFTGALSEGMFWVLPGGAEARFAKAGIELSEHAVVRLAQRKNDVTVDAIIEAYTRGRLFFDPKYRTFIRYDSKTGTVVAVDKIRGGKILTVMRKDNPATRWNPVRWRPGQ